MYIARPGPLDDLDCTYTVKREPMHGHPVIVQHDARCVIGKEGER